MTQDQQEVIETIHQVLKGLAVATIVLNPSKAAQYAALIQASGAAPGISPTAKQMLEEIAAGVSFLSSLGQSKQ